MRREDGIQTNKCWSGWTWAYRRGPMCTLAYRTTVPSIVAASFGGHGSGGHVYTAVSYDGDSPGTTRNGRRNTRNLLTHTCKTHDVAIQAQRRPPKLCLPVRIDNLLLLQCSLLFRCFRGPLEQSRQRSPLRTQTRRIGKTWVDTAPSS